MKLAIINSDIFKQMSEFDQRRLRAASTDTELSSVVTPYMEEVSVTERNKVMEEFWKDMEMLFPENKLDSLDS